MKFLIALIKYLLPILILSTAVFGLKKKNLKDENPIKNPVKSILFFTIYRGNLAPYDYFKYFGDKTFLCVTLLFFQSKTLILLSVTLLIQIMMSYSLIFLNFIITDLIPLEVFQLGGIWAYFLSGATILYFLMFEKEKCYNDKISESVSEMSKISLVELKSVIRILGIVTISRTLDGFIFPPFVGKNTEWPILWIYLGKETSAFIIATLLAMLIGLFLSFMKIHNNLFIASVTYLLLGMNIGLNYLMIE